MAMESAQKQSNAQVGGPYFSFVTKYPNSKIENEIKHFFNAKVLQHATQQAAHAARTANQIQQHAAHQVAQHQASLKRDLDSDCSDSDPVPEKKALYTEKR